MADETEWVSAEEAAEHLNFHLNTVYRLIRAGILPALRFPVRIRRQDLEGVIERCRIKPGELAHLYQYARSDGDFSSLRVTTKGELDRRYGPRRSGRRIQP